ERHESRRIDNQLRGRSGRQGDPGSSRFYVGLDDELMRIFGGERILGIMERFKIDDDTPIEAGILTASIERAQKKVEAHNYEARKHVLEYDDVMNKQRTVVYSERRRVLEGHDLRPSITEIVKWKARQAVDSNCPENVHPHEWDRRQVLDDMETALRGISHRVDVSQLEPLAKDEMIDLLAREADQMYTEKEERMVARYPQLDAAGLHEGLRMLERGTMLQIVDRLWIDHLYTMDSLKQGIGLRGWGQKDPRVEYEKEAYEIFEDLKNNIADEAIKGVFRVVIEHGQPGSDGTNGVAPMPPFESIPTGAIAAQPARIDEYQAEQLLGPLPGKARGPVSTNLGDGGEQQKPAQRAEEKVGRNAPCPCGSGKKYKKCHGSAVA
ncbi:MAG: preprotein translocase subunit SecA, partial [Candidatus Meridianibacter frigidus]